MQYLKFFILFVGLFCFSIISVNAQTPTTASANSSTEITNKTIKVKVKGVGCARDMQAISTSVAKVEGVSICETLKKGATTTFSITFNAAITDEKAIYSAVEETPGCSNQSARPYKVKLK